MLRTMAAACVVALAAQAGGRTPLTVSAALSLTEVMQAVGRAYEAAGHGSLVFNFAASNVLARQIVNGAPVDVFVSADEAQMEIVQSAGFIMPGSRVPIVGNKLVLVVAARSTVKSLADLGTANVRRIAIGDPAAVPAGVYARR